MQEETHYTLIIHYTEQTGIKMRENSTVFSIVQVDYKEKKTWENRKLLVLISRKKEEKIPGIFTIAFLALLWDKEKRKKIV